MIQTLTKLGSQLSHNRGEWMILLIIRIFRNLLQNSKFLFYAKIILYNWQSSKPR